jgi:hypothetical protein
MATELAQMVQFEVPAREVRRVAAFTVVGLFSSVLVRLVTGASDPASAALVLLSVAGVVSAPTSKVLRVLFGTLALALGLSLGRTGGPLMALLLAGLFELVRERAPGRALSAAAAWPLGGAWFLVAFERLHQHKHPAFDVPELLVSTLPGAFIGTALALTYVTFSADPMHRRLEQVDAQAAAAWAKLVAAIARLGPGALQAKLEALSRTSAEALLQLSQEEARLRELLERLAPPEGADGLEELTVRLSRTSDAATRAHLSQAARLLSDTLEQREGFARRLERAKARLQSERAWLLQLTLTAEVGGLEGSEASTLERLDAWSAQARA